MTETETRRRKRSTIVPGRIIIPRLVMSEAGMNDNASYLDEPSVRSDESRKSGIEIIDAPESPEDVIISEVESPVQHDVSMAVQNRPTRNRRAPLRWWLLERPVYNIEKGFVRISKGSSSSDSEVSKKKKTRKTTRKRTKRIETPAGNAGKTKKARK